MLHWERRGVRLKVQGAMGDGASHVGRGRKWLRLVRGVLKFAHARRRAWGVFTQGAARGEIATKRHLLRQGRFVKELRGDHQRGNREKRPRNARRILSRLLDINIL